MVFTKIKRPELKKPEPIDEPEDEPEEEAEEEQQEETEQKPEKVQKEEKTQIVEREVTLSLINEKLNWLISAFQSMRG